MDNAQTPTTNLSANPSLPTTNAKTAANTADMRVAPVAKQVVTADTQASQPKSASNGFTAFPDTKNLKQTTGSLAKILIVEDEDDARDMFVDLLESENYEVSGAVDGNDAIAKAAADKFDLILLDLVMPNKDGLETLQDIKSDPIKFGTPVIVVLTNISGDAAVEKAMELGAAGYRLKIEVEPEQLLKDVNDFLHGKKQDVDVEKVGRSLV